MDFERCIPVNPAEYSAYEAKLKTAKSQAEIITILLNVLAAGVSLAGFAYLVKRYYEPYEAAPNCDDGSLLNTFNNMYQYLKTQDYCETRLAAFQEDVQMKVFISSLTATFTTLSAVLNDNYTAIVEKIQAMIMKAKQGCSVMGGRRGRTSRRKSRGLKKRKTAARTRKSRTRTRKSRNRTRKNRTRARKM